MIDNGIILKNPFVPEGFYFARVTAIETEPSEDSVFPKLLIQLKLHPSHELPENNVFSAILHPTPKSLPHYMNFAHTFLWGESTEDLTKAIGRLGSVAIQSVSFCGVAYSTVRFVREPLSIRVQCMKLELADLKS